MDWRIGSGFALDWRIGDGFPDGLGLTLNWWITDVFTDWSRIGVGLADWSWICIELEDWRRVGFLCFKASGPDGVGNCPPLRHFSRSA